MTTSGSEKSKTSTYLAIGLMVALAGLWTYRLVLSDSGDEAPPPPPEEKASGTPDASPRATYQAALAAQRDAGRKDEAALLELVRDSRASVREQAAHDLAKVDSSESVAALVSLARGDSAPHVKTAAVRSLGTLGEWDGAAAIVDAMDDESLEVRSAAEQAMKLMVPGIRFGYKASDPISKRHEAIARARSAMPVLEAGVRKWKADHKKGTP